MGRSRRSGRRHRGHGIGRPSIQAARSSSRGRGSAVPAVVRDAGGGPAAWWPHIGQENRPVGPVGRYGTRHSGQLPGPGAGGFREDPGSGGGPGGVVGEAAVAGPATGPGGGASPGAPRGTANPGGPELRARESRRHADWSQPPWFSTGGGPGLPLPAGPMPMGSAPGGKKDSFRIEGGPRRSLRRGPGRPVTLSV